MIPSRRLPPRPEAGKSTRRNRGVRFRARAYPGALIVVEGTDARARVLKLYLLIDGGIGGYRLHFTVELSPLVNPRLAWKTRRC